MLPGKASREGAAVKRICLGMVIACAALACGAQSAFAYTVSYPGMQVLHFNAGPYSVHPGANLILLDSNHVPKPNQDGYMVRFVPNLRYALPNGKCCGRIPHVSVIHLHHGVWLSNGAAGQGEGEGSSYGGLYPFMATGEEKTIYQFPRGYGYPIGASDKWILNYMIHNLTAKPAQVYINYTINFVPLTDPARPESPRSTRSGWTSRTTTSTRCSTFSRGAGSTGSSRSPTWPKTHTVRPRSPIPQRRR